MREVGWNLCKEPRGRWTRPRYERPRSLGSLSPACSLRRERGWCDLRGVWLPAHQVLDPLIEKRPNPKQSLEGEEGEHPDELDDREGGPEEGGDQDPDPAEQRSKDCPDP